MTFRSRLIVAFSSILLLTLVLVVTSWWGMTRNVEVQKRIFTFYSGLEGQLNKMLQLEQTFLATENVTHSREVFAQLFSLASTVEQSMSVVTGPRLELLAQVHDQLKEYEEAFTSLVRLVLDQSSFRDRLITESKRLLAYTGELSEVEAERRMLLHLLNEMLIAERDYTLSGLVPSARTVKEKTEEFIGLAARIGKAHPDRAVQLKVFRIDKVAHLYLDTFNEYEEEQWLRFFAVSRLIRAHETVASELMSYFHQETEQALRNTDRLQQLALFITGMSIVTAILLIINLSRRITRPIDELKRSAAMIVEGNLDTSVHVERNDEIGSLGVIFNEMTTRLKESFQENERYRVHLQDLVRARTIELEKEVAERKQAENALRTSEQQLSLIIEQSPVGIILFDRNFRIVTWNRSTENLFGYSMAEAIGRTGLLVVPGDGREAAREFWHSLTTMGVQRRQTVDNVRKQGDFLPCDWLYTPISDAKGTLFAVLAMVQSARERLQAEQELLRVKKLESTGMLAGGIAHDFNNILTAILGSINMSLLDRSLSVQSRNLLEQAEKATIRATSLTKQLLTFAKGGEPVKEATSLADLVRDSAEFVSRGTGVACSFDIADDLLMVSADKGQLSQVIQNLVLNACQAMPRGGKVMIRCTNELAPADSPGAASQVRISVADQGPGIEREVLDKIFDPYFSTKKDGSGLGLAITMSIVVRHGGEILVDSTPGAGTTFTVLLPASGENNAIALASLPPESLAMRRLRILIMDDDPFIRTMLSTMLTTLGHEVLESTTGEECLQIYDGCRQSGQGIDLVILDLTVAGGMGGKECAERLLAKDAAQKILVSSGYSNDPIMARYAEYGFCGALAKPYQIEDMVAVLERICGSAAEA